MSEKCYSSCQQNGEVLHRCAIALVVQRPSTVKWGAYCCLGDRDWVETIIITLAVCGCLPYSPPHKQMVASLACPVYTDKNMWVCVYMWHEYLLVFIKLNQAIFPSIVKSYLKNVPFIFHNIGCVVGFHIYYRSCFGDGSWLDVFFCCFVLLCFF